MDVALPSDSRANDGDGRAGIEKVEVVGVVEQRPGHETAGDDGPGPAEAGDGMARGDTREILALVLLGAAALHVATMVLVELGELIEDEHRVLHGLGDDERDIATVVDSGVLNVAHGIIH